MKKIIAAKQIHTLSPEMPTCKYMVIEDGWIVDLLDELPIQDESDCEIISYSDHYIYPSFNDSHMHLVGYGAYLSQLRLDHTKSIAELKERLNQYTQSCEDDLIVGRSWNQDEFLEKRLPTRFDLDEVCDDRPVILYRVCGHIAVVNSFALKHYSINKDLVVAGGMIDVEDGVLTGILRENALSLVSRSAELEDIKKYILNAQKQLNAYGITSVQTDDLIMVSKERHEALLALFREMSHKNMLTVRIYQQSQFFTVENFQKHIDLGYVQNSGDLFFKYGPLKILADGSLGARTAKLKSHYHDDPNAQGLLIHSENEVLKLMECAFENNIDVAIHGIGDYTIQFAVDAIKSLATKYPRQDARNAIVHCQIMDHKLMREMGTHNISALVQPVFLEYDMTIVKNRVGESLAKTSYAYKSMLNYGIKLGFGSDAPVEDPNPFRSLYYAITRKRPDGLEYYTDESVTFDEALRAFTVDAAYFSHEDHFKGRLLKKHLADFIVTREDLRQIKPMELLNVRPTATYVGGVCVYEEKVM